MNKKAILMVAIVLASMLFISGCTQQTTIKNAEEVCLCQYTVADRRRADDFAAADCCCHD